jgi:uncharacterized protein YuzE
MKIEYSPDVDALYMYFKDADIQNTQEAAEGVIIDLDATGEIVGIEILAASRNEDFEHVVSEYIKKLQNAA